MHEIEQYNMVNDSNAAIPKYNIGNKETYITLYFNNSSDVIIVGNVDNNYIYWLSVTNTEDVELNEQIFNHVANDCVINVAHEYKALKQANIKYDELKDYYSVRLTRVHTHNMAWQTPFGHYYGKDNIEKNGYFFARDIKGFVNSVHVRCELREAGGKYEAVLEEYEAVLSAADTYDYRVRTLDELLKAESYLNISLNENVRKSYKKCCEMCSKLYNAYMTAAR